MHSLKLPNGKKRFTIILLFLCLYKVIFQSENISLICKSAKAMLKSFCALNNFVKASLCSFRVVYVVFN